MSDPTTDQRADPPQRPKWRALVKLARPKQWAKCGFVLIGPMYGYADGKPITWASAAAAALGFGLAASACYVLNDLRDRDADRLHPRKRRRPIASGEVSVPLARAFSAVLLLVAAAAVGFLPADLRLPFASVLCLYVLNVMAYSAFMKRVVILDVISLAGGFVLRVVGGCVATGIEPSPWLLNCTFFLAMFLSFGKRLGERRTMAASGGDLVGVRNVQSVYTDDLLRMSVVVTAVATLITYAGYVEQRATHFWVRPDQTVVVPDRRSAVESDPTPADPAAAAARDASLSRQADPTMTPGHMRRRFYLMWLTMLPATYGLLRCIVLLERGEYDDPTELAAGDRAVQAAVGVFGAVTVGLMIVG